MSESTIITVVEGFVHWSAPWRFLEAVLTHDNLSEADSLVVRRIWADVCSAMHWQDRELADGGEAANGALKRAFPWRSPIARASFVRAAAYEWR